MASLPLLPLEECSRSNFDAPTLLPRWSCETSNGIFTINTVKDSKREAPSMTRISPATFQEQATFDPNAIERPSSSTASTDLFLPLQGPSIIFLDAHCRPTCIANHDRPPPIANLKPRMQPKLSPTTSESENTPVSHLCLYKQCIFSPNNANPNHATIVKRGDFHSLPKFPSLPSTVAGENTEEPVSLSRAVPKTRCRDAAPMLPLL